MCRPRLSQQHAPANPGSGLDRQSEAHHNALPLERNVRLYPAFLAASHVFFQLPVFLLYFTATVTAQEALMLEGLYYLTVVLLEVPSGYASDRLGRRPTLIVASALWAGAMFVLYLAGGFVGFAVGQVTLAAGRAFQSGTNRALLYDSLRALGREHEYSSQEARALVAAYIMLAVTSVLGGFIAVFDLGLTYLCSAIGSLAGVGLAISFREPPRDKLAGTPMRQFVEVARKARDPVLRWVLVFVVAIHVLSHVPYEFAQPWLQLLLGEENDALRRTPVVSGFVFGATMTFGAFGSAAALRMRERFGALASLLLGLGFATLIVGGMALGPHLALIPLVALRSFPEALTTPIAGAVSQGRLDSGMRATWLSLESLAARLAFSVAMVVCGLALGRARIHGGDAVHSACDLRWPGASRARDAWHFPPRRPSRSGIG